MSRTNSLQQFLVPLLVSGVVSPGTANADPVAGANLPARGDYETNWGRARLNYEKGSHQSNLNASLTFADGHVIWGYFQRVQRGAQGPWVMVGRWIAVQNAQGHIPADIKAGNKCSNLMRRIPILESVPESYHWGSIRLVFASSGKAFTANINYCREEEMAASTSRAELRGSYTPTVVTSSAHTVQAPGLARDGQCAATSAVAVAAIEPCALEPLKPLRVRLLRDVPKGIARVTFSPLSDDYTALSEAMRDNRPLPRHPTAKDAYLVVNSKVTREGETLSVTPPGAVCQHDFWSVSVKDGTGAVHAENGVVYMICGPGELDEQVRRPVRLPEPPPKTEAETSSGG